MDSQTLLLAGFTVIAIIMSSTVHEYAHAAVATRLGDDTPARQGRVTLDPTQHIELFGTIILPLIGSLIGGFLIGWARPVQFQPNNFRKDIPKRRGITMVAIAGPLSNLGIVALCLAILKVIAVTVPMATLQASPLWMGFGSFVAFMIYINMVLAVFNLMPIPPLDGFHILSNVLKPNSKLVEFMASYQLIFFFIAIFFIFRIVLTPMMAALGVVMRAIDVAPIFSFFLQQLF